MYRAYGVDLKDAVSKLKNTTSDYSMDTVFSNNYKKCFEDLVKNHTEVAEIDTSKIISSWFPTIKADVFLSHASTDIVDVKKFASWLYREYGIISFIDSLVWKHINELLTELNKIWANERSYSYDYTSIIKTTAHVHVMLTHALRAIIDNTECFIFLESNKSLSQNSKGKTHSPWIFHELATVDSIQIKEPQRIMVATESLGFSKKQKALLTYPILRNRLISLNFETLEDALKTGLNTHSIQDRPQKALDELYKRTSNDAKPFLI